MAGQVQRAEGEEAARARAPVGEVVVQEEAPPTAVAFDAGAPGALEHGCLGRRMPLLYR